MTRPESQLADQAAAADEFQHVAPDEDAKQLVAEYTDLRMEVSQ